MLKIKFVIISITIVIIIIIVSIIIIIINWIQRHVLDALQHLGSLLVWSAESLTDGLFLSSLPYLLGRSNTILSL